MGVDDLHSNNWILKIDIISDVKFMSKVFDDALQSIIKEIDKHNDRTVSYNHVLRYLKSIKESFNSVMLLMEHGNSSSAQILARSLYESYIQFLFFIIDSAKLSSKVQCYYNVVAWNYIADLERKIEINNSSQSIHTEIKPNELEEMRNCGIEFYEENKFLLLGTSYRKKIDQRSRKGDKHKKIDKWYSIYDSKLNSFYELSKTLFKYESKTAWSVVYDNLYSQFSSFSHGFQGYNSLISDAGLEESNLGAIKLLLTLCYFIFDDLIQYLSVFYNDLFNIMDIIDLKVLIDGQCLMQKYAPEK